MILLSTDITSLNEVPTLPGIYFIGINEPLYIGSAVNLRRRLKGHEKIKLLFKYFDKISIDFVIINKSEKEVLFFEKHLINSSLPLLNKESKSYGRLELKAMEIYEYFTSILNSEAGLSITKELTGATVYRRFKKLLKLSSPEMTQLLLNKTEASEYLFGYKSIPRINSLHKQGKLRFTVVEGAVYVSRFELEEIVKKETDRQNNKFIDG